MRRAIPLKRWTTTKSQSPRQLVRGIRTGSGFILTIRTVSVGLLTMKAPGRNAFSVMVRAVIATALGWATWWCYLNGARLGGAPRVVYHVLDWPVATVGLLFPAHRAGIDVFYGRNLRPLHTAGAVVGTSEVRGPRVLCSFVRSHKGMVDMAEAIKTAGTGSQI